MRLHFAGLDDLEPRVIMFGVTRTPAASEPSTTATATTYFPGFRDNAAFEANRTHGRRRHGYRCVCGHWPKQKEMET